MIWQESKFKGVSWNWVRQKWQVKFTRKQRQKWLGLYEDEQTAKRIFEEETEKYNQDPENWIRKYDQHKQKKYEQRQEGIFTY